MSRGTLALGFLAAAGAAAAAHLLPRSNPRNANEPPSEAYRFYCVEPGILYRSGALTKHGTLEEMRALLERHKIRTVVNLVPQDFDHLSEWYQREVAAVSGSGARLVDIPFHSEDDPAPAQANAFVALLRDPANRPVLVHCSKGEVRTGALVGVYLMAFRGLGPDEAFRAVNFNGRLEEGGHVHRFLRSYKPPPLPPAPREPPG